MELRHLHYFLRIAETSSFTQAAARLGVTQPTLSHQIKQLEGELGAPLFDRIGRSVRLTEPGRILREHAQRAMREIEHGVAAIGELAGLVHGSLRVGVFRSVATSLLPQAVAAFHDAHPGIRVAIRQMSLARMEAGLMAGELDLAVTTYVPPASPTIVSEPIFTEPLVLAVGRQHPWFSRRRSRASLEEIARIPLVLRPAGTPSRALVDRCFAARGLRPEVAMEMSSGEATLATVRCSALATLCALRAIEGTTDLRAMRTDEPQLRRSGAILWHRDRFRSAAAQILARTIREAYAAEAEPVAKRRTAKR